MRCNNRTEQKDTETFEDPPPRCVSSSSSLFLRVVSHPRHRLPPPHKERRVSQNKAFVVGVFFFMKKSIKRADLSRDTLLLILFGVNTLMI